ncbi:MAG: UDP-N-acetylmuramoyl-tripeptide--D-alanyl-D-alanine ligase, partial [Atribacterota bacterium]|nr:UDP-N-acetylmuramoyl-tripeptide--D-alanyl-D-alanine ligase [Atribacterota bacterium]
FTREEVQRITGACLIQSGRYPVFDGLAIDSRSCREGQLFVALKGERTDGHFFVSNAFKGGAYGAVVREVPVSVLGTDGTIFQVSDTLEALRCLGREASRRFEGTKIAITGTAGKTTCKHVLQDLLQGCFSVEITPQSFNTVIGVSCALTNFQKESQIAILEAGISKIGEMEELAEIIDPEIVVFTAFGEGHLEGLESVEKVVTEKSKLVGSKTYQIYLNGDSPFAAPLVENWKRAGKRVISFGTREENQLVLSHFAILLPHFLADFSVRCGSQLLTFQVPILFEEVLVSLLPALHMALEWGISPEGIAEVLRSWKPLPGRGNHFNCGGGVVIDDTYNANPLSYRKALKLLKLLNRQGLETWLVAGDMLELGSFASQAHSALLSEALAPPALSGIILFGSHFQGAAEQKFQKALQEGIVRFFSSHQEIQHFLKEYFHSRKNWVVLFKGSRGMAMEKSIPEEWKTYHG